MPKKSSESGGRPRRVPQRRPSHGVVAAILEGAAAVLRESGYRNLTTNRIAERAGVSIGSVYQYYPDKHAVIAALGRELEQRALALFQAVVAHAGALSLTEISARIVRGLASESFEHREVRREILLKVPRAWLEQESRAVDAQVTAGLEQLFEQRSDVRAGNREHMSFIALHAVESVLEAAVAWRPELLADESFLQELTQLAVRYLQKTPTPGEPPS